MTEGQVQLVVSNTETIPGMTIVQSLGLATGSTVRAKHIGKDILAGFKNLIGGEVKQYTELLNDAREQAMQRMKDNAGDMGADAVINVRIVTSMVSQMASEILIYGTAVRLD